MKLIIDIDEEIMEYIKNNGCLSVIYNDEVAKAIINGIPYEERPQGEWIPVNERLPEVYKKVLVSDVFGVYIGEFIDAEENWGGKHFINEHGMQSKSVVAWQPLPEPYKEEGEEE